MNDNSYKFKIVTVVIVILLAIIGSIIYIIFGKQEVNNTTVTPAPSPTQISLPSVEATETFSAVIMDIDTPSTSIFLSRLNESEIEVYTYSGNTEIKNSYDKLITVGVLKVGDIIEAGTSAENELVNIKITSDIEVYKGVMNLVIESDLKRMSINGTIYRYDDSLKVLNDGIYVSVDTLDSKDVLDVYSRDGVVVLISVLSGHGYLELTNPSDFVGGTITIGTSVVSQIYAGSRFTLPEGKYNITASNNDLYGEGTVTISRDKTTCFDLAPFIPEPEKLCSLKLKIEPYGALVYINETLTNYDSLISLPYGQYSINVLLTGYTTYSGTLNLNKESETISISLSVIEYDDEEDPADEDDDEYEEDEEDEAYPTPVG